MNVANLYRKIKQILNDSNVALINKGLSSVDSLYDIPTELSRISINRLPYALSKQIIVITEDDLNNVTSIDSNTFYRCTSLESITIPNGVTSIGTYAFRYCTNLKSVTIPSSVTSIGGYAFSDCRSLESITIPEGIISIGNYIFDSCARLENITIPSSVTTIGNNAFRYCSRLTDIYLNPITPPSLGNIDAIPTTTTIHVPIGSGDAYRNATNWSYHSSRIVEDIEV